MVVPVARPVRHKKGILPSMQPDDALKLAASLITEDDGLPLGTGLYGIQPISAALVERIRGLTEGVEVDLDARLDQADD